jgi:hypothetical protein
MTARLGIYGTLLRNPEEEIEYARRKRVDGSPWFEFMTSTRWLDHIYELRKHVNTVAYQFTPWAIPLPKDRSQAAWNLKHAIAWQAEDHDWWLRKPDGSPVIIKSWGNARVIDWRRLDVSAWTASRINTALLDWRRDKTWNALVLEVMAETVWPGWGLGIPENDPAWLAGCRKFLNILSRDRVIWGGDRFAPAATWIGGLKLEDFGHRLALADEIEEAPTRRRRSIEYAELLAGNHTLVEWSPRDVSSVENWSARSTVLACSLLSDKTIAVLQPRHPENPSAGLWPPQEEDAIDIGYPTGPRYEIAPRVWARDFQRADIEHATVIVNASSRMFMLGDLHAWPLESLINRWAARPAPER